MKGIYNMDVSFNFLLQATRVLHDGNYDENELDMIYNYIVTLDNDTLNDYNNQCNILVYDSDLDLYLEIIEVLVKIFEEKEEYEKCDLLSKKKEESLIIKNNKTI
jgi:hypothetical protein